MLSILQFLAEIILIFSKNTGGLSTDKAYLIIFVELMKRPFKNTSQIETAIINRCNEN